MQPRIIKRLIVSLAAILTICIPIVNVSAVSNSPVSGNYTITNAASHLELALNRNNQIILNNTESYVWKLTAGPASNPYYYTITTQDGRFALAYNGGLDVVVANSSLRNQQWLITPVIGGFNIQSLIDVPSLSPGDSLPNDGPFLRAAHWSSTAPGTVTTGQRENNELFVWRITSVVTATPTLTPTQTPTPTARMPRPTSNLPTGSVIRRTDRIQLSPPAQFPNARVEYTLVDPNRNTNVTWHLASVPINTPSSGTLEVWARTQSLSGRAASEIEYFIFYIDRVPGASPTPTPTPWPTQQPLNQVILRVTMNQLQYTVNGSPYMFDVAPYLDTRVDRSMIPMRFIAEAFGATVTWDDSTKTQHIRLGSRSFSLTEGVALAGGMGTPVLVRDRFFVPLRYVSQELGASVTWDTPTQTNTIVYFR